MPRADEHALGAELHHQGRVGRASRCRPAEKLTTGRRPSAATRADQLVGRAEVLGRGVAAPRAAGPRAGRCRSGSRACGARPRPRCRCRPRPWCGSSPRPRRCAAAPRPGRWRRTRTGTVKACLSMWWASSAGVRTSDSSMKSTSRAWRTWASTKWPMRHLAITGIVTASWMPEIISGSLMRATPPSARMSAGMRSSAITAQAPASSAMRGLLGGRDVHDDAALQHLGEPRLDAHRPGAPVALGHALPFSVGSERKSLPDPLRAPRGGAGRAHDPQADRARGGPRTGPGAARPLAGGKRTRRPSQLLVSWPTVPRRPPSRRWRPASVRYRP